MVVILTADEILRKGLLLVGFDARHQQNDPPFDQIYGNQYAKAGFLGGTLSLRIVIQKVGNFHLLSLSG
jgi:hypothetical protein